jgi:hypothetical protein
MTNSPGPATVNYDHDNGTATYEFVTRSGRVRATKFMGCEPGEQDWVHAQMHLHSAWPTSDIDVTIGETGDAEYVRLSFGGFTAMGVYLTPAQAITLRDRLLERFPVESV